MTTNKWQHYTISADKPRSNNLEQRGFKKSYSPVLTAHFHL